MNTSTLRNLADKLDSAINYRDALVDEAALLTLSGHQSEITLSVFTGRGKGRAIQLSRISRAHSYASVQVRGTEMIMLGVKKWYAAAIDEANESICAVERQMRAEVGGAA